MNHSCQNIKHLRKLVYGATQEEFAELLGIKRSLMGAYEEQRALPNFTVLKRLSDIFQLTVDDIIYKDLTILKSSKMKDLAVVKGKPKKLKTSIVVKGFKVARCVTLKNQTTIELIPINAA